MAVAEPVPAPRVAPPGAWSEAIFSAVTRGAGIAVLTLAAALVAILVSQALPALARAGEYRMFTSSEWTPKPPEGGKQVFGVFAFVYGTVVTSVVAMLIAVPLGVASAAYLSEVAGGTVRKVGAFLVELLAAIPSVVYGFWGVFFVAPIVQAGFNVVGGPNTGGNGILASSIILAIMVLPYITAIGFDVCQAVPRSQREGSLALGATKWQTIWNVVLPYARPGIIAACFLALGRALGETMAVTMLIGNNAIISLSPFATGDSIASKIANSLNEADDPMVRSALIALALVLLVVTATFNVLARLLLARLTRGPVSTPSAQDGAPNLPPDLLDLPDPHRPPEAPKSAHPLFWNRVMITVLGACFVATVIPLFLILGYITVRGAKSIEPTLFTNHAVAPLTNEQFTQYVAAQKGEAEFPTDYKGRPLERGGLGHAMAGSLMIVVAATLMAVPVGLLTAVYLSEARGSRFAHIVRFVAEMLGGVPSIVIGIFAYALFVYPFWSGTSWGFSGWAGAFALMVMMIPIIIRTTEESMKLVPDGLRHASYALGANKMQTVVRIVLPAALPAIVTGIFLAIGRIAGETAPLLLTAGQLDYWPKSPLAEVPLAQATPFLPGYIFNYAGSPQADRVEQAWGAALVLLTVVMCVNVGIRLIAGKRQVAASRSD